MAVGSREDRLDDAADFAPAARDALEHLITFLENGQGRFQLGAVYYDLPGQRDEILIRIRERLPNWNLVAVSLQDLALDLNNLSPRLIESLREIAAYNAGGRAIDAVLLLDWDRRLAADLPADEQPPSALVEALNIGREALRERFDCPLVFMLPKWALAKIKETAVDLTSWISGSFYFSCDPARVAAGLAAILEDVARIRARGDMPQAIDRLWAGLTDASALDRIHSVPDLVARFLHRLGELYLGTGDMILAETQFERLGRWARQHNLDEWPAKADRGVQKARRGRTRPPARTVPPGGFWEILRGPASLTETDLLIGREDDLNRVEEMLHRADFRVGVIWGHAGCGKTSLVRAGLAPSLQRQGHLPVYVDRYDEGEDDVRRAVVESSELGDLPAGMAAAFQDAHARTRRRLFLICDQFERVFEHESPERGRNRGEFLGALARAVKNRALPLRCLILIRADQLYRLAEFDPLLPSPVNPLEAANRYELGFLRLADAERVLAQMGEKAGLGWPAELVIAVIRDLARDRAELNQDADQDLAENRRVIPVEIQMAAAGLYLQKVSTLGDYEALGGISSLLGNYLSAVLGTFRSRQIHLRRAVRSLVSRGAPVRRESLTVEEVAHRARIKLNQAGAILESLIAPHIVQSVAQTSPPRFELVHDVLAEPARQAANPQEIGLGILMTALAGNSDLGIRDLWASLPYSRDPLPSALVKRARRLQWRSAAKIAAKGVGVVAVFLVLFAAWLQLTNTFVRETEKPPNTLVVYQGIPGLQRLGGTELFDTGIPFAEVSFEQGKSDKLHALRAMRRDGGFSRDHALDAGTKDLLDCLTSGAKARWQCYLGDWDGGIQTFREIRSISPGDADWQSMIAVAPPAVVVPLYDMLNDKSPARVAAVWAVGELREIDAAEAITRLEPLLADDDPKVKETTAEAIAKLGNLRKADAIRALLPLTLASAWGSRPNPRYYLVSHENIATNHIQATCDKIASLGVTESDIKPLLGKLQSSSPQTRADAAIALGYLYAFREDPTNVSGAGKASLLGAPAARAAEALEHALRADPEPEVRSWAVRALGLILRDDRVRLVADLLPAIQRGSSLENPENRDASLGRDAIEPTLFWVWPTAGPADEALRDRAEQLAKELDKLRAARKTYPPAAQLAIISMARALSRDRVRKLAEELVAEAREGISKLSTTANQSAYPTEVPRGLERTGRLLSGLAFLSPESTLAATAAMIREPNDVSKILGAHALLYYLFLKYDPGTPPVLSPISFSSTVANWKPLSRAAADARQILGQSDRQSVVQILIELAETVNDAASRTSTIVMAAALVLPSSEVGERIAAWLLNTRYELLTYDLAPLDPETLDLIFDRALARLESATSDGERVRALELLKALSVQAFPVNRKRETAVEPIRRLLSDQQQSDDVRLAAAEALETFATEQDSRLTEDFLRLITGSKRNLLMREPAIRGLGKVGATKAEDVARAILAVASEVRHGQKEGSSSAESLSAEPALKSLAARNPGAVVSALLPYVDRGDDAMRSSWIRVLAKVGADHPLSTAANDKLEKAALEKDRDVRDAAESALAEAAIWKALRAPSVFKTLLADFQGDRSRRDSAHRHIVAEALIRWYNDGLDPRRAPPTTERRGRACDEHQLLFEAVSALRQDKRIWLRPAACLAYAKMNAIQRGIRSGERDKTIATEEP
jgi:hypothetical protein